MKRLELSDLQPLVGTTFAFSREHDGALLESTMSLTELSAYELSKRDRRATDTSGKYRSVPFSAIFEGLHSLPLPQASYSVRHASTGETLEIFITCIGPNATATGFEYEAVFT